jgi:enoyl-CoA hydratase/carnithine racemase
MRWMLTGDEFDAHDALHLGLVQEVMASEDCCHGQSSWPSGLPGRRHWGSGDIDVGPAGAL